jgi:hypothetical protein
VPAYFDKLMNSRDEAVRLQTAMLFVKNKRPVADSVFVRLGKDEKKRKKLYQELEDVERLDLFPKQYRNQEQMAKAMLTIENTSYNKKDSITSLNIKMPVSYKGNRGYVYFFKYKEGKKDEDWMIATSGPQPMDTTKVNIEDDMVEFTGKLIKKDKPLKEQLEKILKEALYEKNKVSSRFYDRYRDRYDYNRTYRSRR